LCAVDVEDDALRAADLAHLLDGLDDADLVVHEHHRGEDGIGAQRRFELLQVDQAVLQRVEVGHLEAVALQLARGVEHGLVLGLHRDEVLALALVEEGGALDGEVVRFGGAGGPHDFLRVGADQRGDVLARLFDGLLRLPAVGMRARGWVAELFDQPGNHLLGDARVDRGRRGIVEVDGEFQHAHLQYCCQAATAASPLSL
jgi:hypothetical protein